MKKVLSYAFIALFGAGVFAACSGENENTEATAEDQNNAQPTEQQAQQVLNQDNAELVTVNSAEVVTEPNGTQQVQTDVTLQPEQVPAN